MKIVYLHQYFKFPTENGGTRSYDLAKKLVKFGYEITIVSSTSDISLAKGNRWSVINKDGLEVHYIYIPYSNHLTYFRRVYAFTKFMLFSTLRLLRLRCDLVIATSTPLTIGMPAIIKKWLSKTPYVFEVRDVWPEAVIAIGAIKNKTIQKFLIYLEKLIYKNAYSIVPLSTDMKKSIVGRFPSFSEKIHHVIPNISEIDRFQNIKNNINLESLLDFKPRFTVLYAGTFGHVNGLHNLIELAHLTKDIDPSLCYILVGDGSLKESITKLSKIKGVYQKNLFILDPVSKNELANLYSAVSMGSSFVLDIKELWANSANKFFDTLAASKPILINHEGWQADVIRKNNLGFVLSAKVDKAIANDFVSYTKNEFLYTQQCQNAFKTAREKFSLDIAAKKYIEILQGFETQLHDFSNIKSFNNDPGNNKKTIWYVNKYFAAKLPTTPGGRDWNLLNILSEKGYQVCAIGSDSNSVWDGPVLNKPVTIQNINNLKVVWLKTYKYKVANSISRILSWFHFEWKLFFLNKKQLPNPDVVVISSLSLLTIINGVLLKRKYKCRLVFEIRDIWPLTIVEEGGFSNLNPAVMFLGFVEKIGYKKSDVIIGTMPNLVEHVRLVSSTKAPVYCVPMGVSENQIQNSHDLPEAYKKNYLSKSAIKIVHAGTIGITNALDTFFVAADILKDNDNIQFVVVGDGPLREKYINEYSYLENLIFAPKVNKYQVQAVLAECDIVYFSTFDSKVWKYGQSLNKVIDYMLSGKPIIASYSGFPSMINEAGCGEFVPAGDSKALVETILKYSAMSKDELKSQGLKGRNWLLENRNYDKLANDFERIVFDL